MKIRAYRALCEMTQKQFAARIGVTELSVIKYESGANIPSREVMRRIFVETGGAVAPNDFYDLESLDVVNNVARKKMSQSPTLTVIGLMSGTSMDGIDAALVSTDGQGHITDLGSDSLKYDPEFKLLMKGVERAVFFSAGDLAAAEASYPQVLAQHITTAMGLAESESAREVSKLAVSLYGSERPIVFRDVVERSTRVHAQVVQSLLEKSRFGARDVDLIGYHGQTVFHRPAQRITIQLGDGQLLSDLTSIPVVYDFRMNDVLAGGQGAPFAPLYHAALARQMGLSPVVVANCGGIANITVITGNDAELTAFDTGPGNALIDRFVKARVGRECDEDGVFGRAGTVNLSVLAALRTKAVRLADGSAYLDRQPPKSLDVNDLHLIPELDGLTLQDGCATLEHFTAECIVESLRFVSDRGISVPHLWVTAGGGWKNPVIFEKLRELLTQRFGSTIRVEHADKVGWNGTALEAQIFAYLAVRSAKGLPLSVPGTTGVPAPLTGGKFVLPDGDVRRASGRLRDLMPALVK